MTALLLLAAETGEEKSKTAFYIAGIAFAAWAVIVGFIGITRPKFPDGPTGRAVVITISLTLMVAAMATAVLTAG